MTQQSPPAPQQDPPAPPTVEEQLSSALSGLTTGLAAYKRAKGEVTAANEAESAQKVRLSELRVLTETAESDSEGVRNVLFSSIDGLRGVLSALKASITD